jgi:hypothetical protein
MIIEIDDGPDAFLIWHFTQSQMSSHTSDLASSLWQLLLMKPKEMKAVPQMMSERKEIEIEKDCRWKEEPPLKATL